jgi:uncharacterized protein YndB with AHSA1/START domain
LEISRSYHWESLSETPETSDTHPLRFYAELLVDHSPSEVWSYFTDLTTWGQWSPICGGCRTSDVSSELRGGSILEINFAVLGFPMTVPCRVIQIDPPGSITWQGKRFGIEATHTYRFVPQSQGTLICNEETFAGAGLLLREMIRAWYRASGLSEKSLRGIRRELLKTTER